MRYYYDASGFISSATVYTLSSGNVTGTYTYLYRTNIQGDVIGIYTTDGTLLVSYVYDAWGNVESATAYNSSDIVNLNPFRYRSYYYDTEIELYYLNTRYYDPNIGRFINSDGLSNLGANGDLEGYNLYAYCSNNPVMGYDPSGESFLIIGLFLAATTFIGGVLGATSDEKLLDNSFGKEDEVESSEEKPELTFGDRVVNALVGATLGLFAGGGIVAGGAAIYGGMAGLTADFFGITALQGFAVGGLAFNTAAIILPVFGVEVENMIEM